MDFGKLFFSTEGRIGQRDFWIGAIILLIIGTVAVALLHLALLVWLFLIWPWVAIYAKRLHDFGRSAFMIVWPFLAGIIFFVLGLVFGGVGVIGLIWTTSTSGSSAPAWGTMLGSFGVMLVFFCLAAVAKFIFLFWVGMHRGDQSANQYGQPPGMIEPAAPTVA